MIRKKSRKILLILAFVMSILLGCVSFYNYTMADSTFNLKLTPQPTENGNRGAVSLDWSTYSEDNVIFKGYQSTQGGAEESWKSISLMDYSKVKEVKVLQIYPDVESSSTQLKDWMNTQVDGQKIGKDIINVNSVKMTDFNNNPNNYLNKGSQGWNYDVIFFGTADRNGRYDLSDKSREVVDQYISDGYGCIFGHDTILNNSTDSTDSRETISGQLKKGQVNFDKLAAKYFTALKYEKNADGGQLYYGGNEVKIVKNGLFTTYPWSIGEIGTKLTIPTTHTWGQVVQKGYEGDIWLRFTAHPDEGYNFYLITQNNVSMIQTGHSGGQATTDEQKIIANLIFSSYQISSNTSTIDRSAMDYAKPTTPTINVKEESGNMSIDFSSEDEGTEYTYKVEAYDKLNTDVVLATSNTPTVTVTSGFDKYYYVIDNNEVNDFDIKQGGVEQTETGKIIGTYEQYGNKYIHIKAVDKAGNVSDVATASTKDTIAPELNATPNTSEWGKEVKVNLEFTDKGGSGFRGYQYAITDSQDERPSSWNTEKPNSSDTITITEEGTKYLHVIAFDKVGNYIDDKVMGPYLIDHSAPTVELIDDLETIVTDPLEITINSSDSLSGVKEVIFDSRKLDRTDSNVVQIDKNGTYNLKVEDNVGNVYTNEIVVNNIYQKCNKGLDHPNYTTSIETCPICDLIEGIQITNDRVVYNGQEQKLTYNNSQEATVVEYYNGLTEKPVDVGSYEYELKVNSNGTEYKTGIKGTFNIDKKEISIQGIAATNRQYNGTNKVNIHGGNLVGVESSDIEEVNFNLSTMGTTSSKNVGTYNVTIPEITLSGDKAKNYHLQQPAEDAVSVEITAKDITIENITATSRQYNATNVVEIQNGNLVGIEDGDVNKVNFVMAQKGTTSSKDVGTYNVTIPEITLEGDEATNYHLQQPLENAVSVEITPKDITIENITATSRQYDGTNIVEIQNGILVGIENLDIDKVNFVMSKTGTIENKNVGTYNVQVPEIRLEGDEATNYHLQQPSEDAVSVEITVKDITIENITATSRQYNATNIVEIQNGNLVGLVDSDINKVNFVMSQTGTISNKNVGTYNVTIPEITLEGEEATNYHLQQPSENAVSVEITPKDITIENITATSRQYDGTNIVEIQNGELVGVEELDTNKVSFVLPDTGTIENKDVGTYNVTISEITLEGEEATNYHLQQPSEDAVSVEITKRTLVLSKIKGKDRRYNKSNVVDIQGGKLLNVVKGEDVKAIIPKTGIAESEKTGTWTVKIEEITLEGVDIENYELVQPSEEDITVIISRAKQPKMHLEPYISKINGEEKEEVKVQITKNEKEKIKYIKPEIKEKIRYGDKIEITIPIYNEGQGNGYVEKIINKIPEGLKYLEDDETNIENGWKETENNLVESRIFEFEDGEENEIKKLGDEVDYRELKIELEVTEKGLKKEEVKDITTVEVLDIEGEKATEEDKSEEREPEYGDDVPERLKEEGWEKETEDETGKEVWTTDPTNPSNKEKWVDPSDPESDLDENTEIYPVYKKDITVTRNVYLNTHPIDDPLTGTAYRSFKDDTIEPAEIALGTASSIKVNGKQATPKYWSKSKEPNAEDLTEENTFYSRDEETVKLNGVAHLTKDTEYNMSYKYEEEITYVKPDGTKGKTKQDVDVGSDGEEKRGEIHIPEEDKKLPEDLKDEGWTNATDEEGKQKWTTDPSDPGNKENWIDPSDPDTKIDPDTPIYPVYSKEIKVTRNVYLNTHPIDDPLIGILYRSIEDDVITPAKVNLGETKTIEIEGKQLVPKLWVTELGSEEAKQNGVKPNEEVTLLEDEEYYMIYKYEITVKVPDENGEMQDKKIEVEIDSKGEKQNPESEEEKGKIDLPENPKKPDGWDDDNTKFEGWVKGKENKDNPDAPIIDPETDVPEEGDEYYPKFTRTVTVKRYVHPESTKMEPDITTKVTAIGNNKIPSEVELGTTEGYMTEYENEQKQATPKGWSRTKGKTAKVEVAPEGKAKVTDNTDFYMLYSIIVKKEFVTDPDTGETEERDQELLEDPDGNKTLGDTEDKDKEKPKVPDDLKDEGWTNGTDEEGNQKWTTDPDDPEGKDANDEDGKLYPVYEKEVTVERYIYPNSTKLEPDLTGKIYRTASKNSEITPAKINLGTTEGYETQVDGEIQEATPKGWSKTKGSTAKVEVELNGEAEVTEDTDFYMLYSITEKRDFVIDPETGETEERDQEVLEDPDGNKTLGDSEDKDKEKPKLPDDLKEEGWKNGTDEEGNQKWTTDPTDPEGKDANDEDGKLYPVYEKEITVKRHVYPESKLLEPDLIGKMYRTADENSKITPAKVNLGTTENITTKKGKIAEPKLWADTVSVNVLDTTKNNTETTTDEKTVKINGEAHLTKNAEYYMLYSYNEKLTLTKPDQTTGTTEVTINVNANGEERRNTDVRPGSEVPEDLKNDGWEKEKGEETGKEVWTTDPTDPSNKEKWIDPEDEGDSETPIYPVYSKEIKVERYIYPNNTKLGPELKGKVYRSIDEDTIVPTKINLGTDDKTTEIDGKQVTPKLWVTELGSEEAKKNGVKPNEEATLTADEEFYMIYKYEVTVKVPDETGEPQDKKVEVEVGSNGEKEPGNGEDEKGGIDFPENPKKPEGWTDPDDNTEFEGWVKGEENKDNPDAPVIDPETEVPEEGDEYFPKFTRTIKVERYIYPNNTKVETDLTGKVTAIGDNIIPAKVNLGTDDKTTEIDGKQVTPKLWVTELKSEEAKQNGIKPNEEATLLQNEEFYMIYKYEVTVKVPDETGEPQDKKVEVEVDSNGEKKNPEKGEEGNKGIEFPENPKKPEGWTDPDTEFKGWVKGEENKDNPDAPVIDPETEVPEEGDEYFPKFTRTIKVERYIYPNNTKVESDLTGTVTAIGNNIIPAKVNLGTDDETREIDGKQLTPKLWVTELGSEEAKKNGVKPNEEASLTANEEFYMIYKYEVTVKVPDETGEPQDKKVEVEVDSNGEKKNPEKGEEGNKGIEFPENPKKPEGWTDPDTEFKGWVKGEENKDNPDAPVIDPETEIPEEGDKYFPKFTRTIKVERYIYPSNTKIEVDLTGTVTAIGDNIIPAKVNLGTDDKTTEIDGKQVTPKLWVTELKSEEAKQNGIKPNEEATLLQNEEFYMIYKYEVTVKVPDETGEPQDKKVEVEVDSNGEKEPGNGEDEKEGIDFPENPKKPEGWTDPDTEFKGWVKGEENKDNPDAPVIDPETEVPEEGDKYFPKFTRTIKVERYIYPNNTKLFPDLAGTVTAIGNNIIPAKVNLGTDEQNTQIDGKQVTPKLWVTELGSEEAKESGIKPNEEASLTANEEFYMIYKYEVTVKVPDETGEPQDKKVEVEVDSNGEKKNPEKGEEGGKGGIDFPENPKKPEGWTDPDENTEFEGWVKGEENKDNPDAPVIDPETEIPEEGDEYFPKFTRTIKVERYIYPNSTKVETDLTGKVTAIGDNIIPAKVNLGTDDKTTEIDGKQVTPKLWVTELKSEEAKQNGIKPNEEATLLQNEEFYMIYKYEVTVKQPDENGDMQDKKVEVEVDPNGEKQNPDKGEEGEGSAGIEFPENPKPPEGWTNPDDNTEFKGWVKGEENKDNPDAPVIDPETEIPEEGDEYFPKFTKTVTAIRYIYDKENEMQKVLKDENGKDLTGTVTAIGDNIIPAKINLGTTESIEINEKTATPRFWSTSSEADVTQNETSVELNAEAQIKETTKYYMSYSYDVTLAYHDGSSQQTKQIKVMVSSEGIVKGNEFTLEDPSVPEGWTTFIGWTKGNVSPNTTVIDKETEKVDGNEIYHATFTKEVTLTYDANSTGVSGLPSPQTATAYKNDVEEIYPKIIISQDKPQKNKREFKGWSNKSGESALVSYNAGTEIEIRDNKTIYAVWETYPIGDPQTYGDKVTYDVDINGNSDYSDDWIIYHYDGDYLYLISREYLPENKMPEALSTTMAVDRTYGFYWKSLSQSITLNNIQSTFMSRYFKIFDRNANYTNVNSRFISDLLNTNNWEGLKGKYGEEVIGSPTLELLHASYKAKYPNSPLAKQTLSADNSGYLIGGTISSGINTITGDNLYCILDTSKYNRYWLASPASLDTGETYKNAGLYAVGNMGQINGSAAVDSEGHVYGGALRPVIRLKGGISGKADENNNWEIEEPPFAGPKISVDTKNWTKKVTVTIDHIGDSGAVTEYSFTGDEGDWTTYESPFTVEEEDKTVYARTTFKGKEIRTSMSLSNIDITPPEVKDIYLEGTEVVSKMFDAKSGLTHAKAKVEGTSKYGSLATDWTDLTTNNNGNPIVGRDYNVTYSNYYNVGTFTVYVKDAAGNETEMPKAISNPDNSPPVVELASSNVESDTSCPHCGKPAKPWVIEFSATEEGSGLTSLTTGQWQEEIVKEDVGFTVCKTCEESPQWGSKSGKYRMKLYVHNPTGGETTYNFSIQDIYGNESNKAVASVNFYESDNDPPTVELVSSKNLGTITCPHCSKQAIHWQSTFRASDISGLRSCSTDWSQNSKELWNDCTRVSSSPADGAKSGTYVRDSYIHDLEASVQLYVDFTISDVTGHTSTPVRSTINLRGSDNIAPVVSLSSSQDLGIQNCPYCNSSARHWRVVINASDSGTGLYPFSSEWNIVNNSYYTGHFKTTSPDRGAKSGTYTEDLYFHNLTPVQCRKQYYALDLNDNQSNSIEVTMDLYP